MYRDAAIPFQKETDDAPIRLEREGAGLGQTRQFREAAEGGHHFAGIIAETVLFAPRGLDELTRDRQRAAVDAGKSYHLTGDQGESERLARGENGAQLQVAQFRFVIDRRGWMCSGSLLRIGIDEKDFFRRFRRRNDLLHRRVSGLGFPLGRNGRYLRGEGSRDLRNRGA